MLRLLFILLILILSSSVFAQVSVNVPLNDPVYRAIDRLEATGITKGIIFGQRPYTKCEIARILIEADQNFENLDSPLTKMMVHRLLKYWKSEYRDEIEDYKRGRARDIEFSPFDKLDFSYEYVDNEPRNIYNNGVGGVDAVIHPLTQYRGARHYGDGHNYSFESHHLVKMSHFLIYAEPRFQLQIVPGSIDRDPENKIFVQNVYVKTGFGNLDIEAGRDQIAWGQGEFGGLIFSTNGRALDFIKVANQNPFRLPGFLSHLGFFKGSIFLANMGPDYDYPYSYMTGWKISFKPVDIFELGFDYLFIIGGDNSPIASAETYLREFFGFIPGVTLPSGTVANEKGGFDFRLRIPPLSDLVFYSELFFENADLSNPEEMFKYRAAYMGGFYFPRLGGANNMGLRFEYAHTAPLIYRNTTWNSGFSLGGDLLGHPLGPDADGFYLKFYYDLGISSMIKMRLAYERRYGDRYNFINGNIVRINSRPAESRIRGVFELEHPFKNARLKWLFGCEAIDNFNFASDNDRYSFIGGIHASFDLPF